MSETDSDVVSARQRAVENERFRQMFENTPGFVATLRGPEHRFEFTNRAYRDLVGGRDVIGRTVAEALPEVAAQGFLDILSTVYQSGQAYHGERVRVELAPETGHTPQTLYLDFIYQPIYENDGRVGGVLVQGSDVTEHARAASALRVSRERYRLLFDLIEEGFCVIRMLFDADGRPIDYGFREFNPAFSTQTGIRAEDALGGKTARTLYPGLEAFWIETYGRVAMTGESTRFENYAAPMNKWFEVHAFRIGGEGSPEVGVLFKDVTARRVAEEQERLAADFIHQGAARLTAAVSVANLGVWEWDVPTRRVRLDDRSREIWNIDGDDRDVDLGAMIARLHPADRDGVRREIGLAIDSGVARELEYRLVWADGSIRTIVASGEAFRAESGASARMVGVFRDVTEQRRVAEQRELLLESERLARSDAERQGRMKDEFLATLSHELRTPLNAIVGWVEILKAVGADAASRDEGLAVIERNARAQTQIIEDILDMSRITSGKLRLNMQPVDLPQLLRAGADTVQPSADARGVGLFLDLHAFTDPVAGDPTRLQQVFWNLLSNAVKFTPRGGRVDVTLRRAASQIEVSISDTGQGIAPAFLPHVFDRFRQADASTTRKHGGLGLGLSIVRQLVDLHGGSVHARSDGAGHGATFVVTLPVTFAGERPHDPVAEPRPADNALAIDREAWEHLTGVRVLAIDDEPDGQSMLRRLLGECGAVVQTAGSVAEAMRLFDEHRPAVIVSDIGMPGEDGYSLIRRIRTRPPEDGGGVPAIALTAYARQTDRDRAIEAGFQAHLTKPLNAAELLNAVVAAAKLAKRHNAGRSQR